MAFDPDKFLEEAKGKAITLDKDRTIVPAGGFDPDKFLSDRGTVSGAVPPAKPEERTIGERIGTGFMDPFYGMAQIGARLEDPYTTAPLSPQEREERIHGVDKLVQDREAGIKKRAGEGFDWWRAVGQGANPALYAPAFIGGLPGAAATGVTAALLQPEIDHTESFALKKAKAAMWGGVFGLGGGVATNVLGRAVSPIVGQAAQELMNRDIPLTPGRLGGVLMSRMEDAATSIPWLGHFIRNAQMRSVEGFNIAAINTALEPIGAALPVGTQAGRAAMAAADHAIDQEYGRVLALPNLRMGIDANFAHDLQGINQGVLELPANMQTQFQEIMRLRLGDRLRATGSLDGRMLQDVQSAFGQFQRDYSRSPDPDQRRMGLLFGDVREAILDALQRQNPSAAQEFGALRNSFAMFLRLQEAGSRRAGGGGEGGVFTPMDLGAAAKKTDPTRRKSNYNRGDAVMQELAEWGQFVLPRRMPDSGTPERWLWTQLGLGAATGHTVLPGIGTAAFVKAAAVAGVASSPYTRAGMAMMNYYADSAPWRRAARRGIERAVPATGAPAGAIGAMRFDAQGNRVEGQ